MKNELYYVDRLVVEDKVDGQQLYEDSPSKPITDFRNVQRYVLLGEPGAGKTRCFRYEKDKLEDGLFISASDFIDLDEPEWQNKILFIDGLDEVIANAGNRTPLNQIRAKLNKLNIQRYRISCRAADWHGERDQNAIERASGEIKVLQLQGLTEANVKTILQNDSRVIDAKGFYEQAQSNQLGNFLSNPQTLDMLIEVTEGGFNWPTSKHELYQEACAVLSKENNPEHAESSTSQFLTEELLDAAGELYAYMLIANGQIFKTDQVNENGVISLPKLGIKKEQPHYVALKTRLFNPISNTTFTSIHRSVAEFLAARYLASKLDEGLTLRRCFALITGFDGGPVAALRGLYAWLGTFSSKARGRIIEVDALGLIQYGDVTQFSVTEKVKLISTLKTEAIESGYLNYRDEKGFAAFVTHDMLSEFKRNLSKKDYTKPHQEVLAFILDGMRHAHLMNDLKSFVLDIVIDRQNIAEVRWRALEIYIRYEDIEGLLALIEDIKNLKVEDNSDELTGMLLSKLFPKYIPASKIFNYLKMGTKKAAINDYRMFWEYHFLNSVEDADIPELLDQLAKNGVDSLYYGRHTSLVKMAGTLLCRGLEHYGNSITAERLYNWLGIGFDPDGEDIYAYDANQTKEKTVNWLESHPEAYLKVLKVSLSKIKDPQKFYLDFDSHLWGATPPRDIARWWLDEVVDGRNKHIKDFCFIQAYRAMIKQSEEEVQRKLLPWLEAHKEFLSLYKELTAPPSYIQDREERRLKWKEKADAELKNRLNYFEEQKSALLNGSASPYALHHLASAYFDHYANVSGETGTERLNKFLDKDEELIQAAITGISKTLERNDLPTEDEVFKLSTEGKINYLQLPFLTAIEKRYTEDVAFLDEVSDEIAQRALAYWFSYGAGNQPAWVKELMLKRPELSSRVVIHYMTTMLQKKIANIYGYYQLAHDGEYTEIAKRVVMPVLSKYPTKSLASNAAFLEALLKMAIYYVDHQLLLKMIEQKLGRTSLDVLQRVYLLATGLVIAPGQFELRVKAEVTSAERVNHLSGFLYEGWSSSYKPIDLSASTIELLITLIAPLNTPDWPNKFGLVTKYMHDGDFVQTLINRLCNMPEKEVGQIFERLLQQNELSRWHLTLRSAQQEYVHNRREAEFKHPTAKDVVETVNQNRPANVADLAAMVLDYLEEMQRGMCTTAFNEYKNLWNDDSYSRLTSPKVENTCARYLAKLFKDKFSIQDIEVNSESLAPDDTRADIRLVYHRGGKRLNLPVEIKRNFHPDLWTAMHKQLIELYTIEPDTQGRGIYLVLWFGAEAEYNVTSRDGGSRPKSATELQTRLIATMTPEEQKLIDVFVLDVSKPS